MGNKPRDACIKCPLDDTLLFNLHSFFQTTQGVSFSVLAIYSSMNQELTRYSYKIRTSLESVDIIPTAYTIISSRTTIERLRTLGILFSQYGQPIILYGLFG